MKKKQGRCRERELMLPFWIRFEHGLSFLFRFSQSLALCHCVRLPRPRQGAHRTRQGTEKAHRERAAFQSRRQKPENSLLTNGHFLPGQRVYVDPPSHGLQQRPEARDTHG